MTETMTPLRKTALNAVHRAAKAKMVDFGGWDMPVDCCGSDCRAYGGADRGGRVRRVAYGGHPIARAGIAGGGAAACA